VDLAAVRIDKANHALAPTCIESAMQCLRKRIDLIAVATSRERQDLGAEVIEPAGLAG
jgi:hypothetical protein